MSHQARIRAAAVLSVVFGLLVVGCVPYSNPTAPPTPTTERIPTAVGRIEGWGEANVSYLLDTGDVVVVHGGGSSDAEPAALLSETGVWMPSAQRPGGLLLAGDDADGRFYAATLPDDGGCFLMRGPGYIETDRVHLSSGLVLLFAEEPLRFNHRGSTDESWLLSFDHICLDGQGRVTSIRQLPLGA